MKPPARAVVGQLVWSRDGGVWAVWRVEPFPHTYTSTEAKLEVHRRLRGMLMAAPPESMLLSVCERLDRWDVVADMAEGVDLDAHPRWATACETAAAELADRELHRRRYYLAVCLPGGARGWLAGLRAGADDVTSGFGLHPGRVSDSELEARGRQARAIEARLERQVDMSRASAGEIRWLYARALRRDIDEPAMDDSWEPVDRSAGRGSAAVVAHLTQAVTKEGGYKTDPDRPRFRRYVRIDTPSGTAYQTVLVAAELPRQFQFPGGAGEWLYRVDDLDFPIDWCVRVRSVANAAAQAKVRRKQRDLVGQVDEYDGAPTGAPPDLADAIEAIAAERSALAANSAEPELQVTILMSIAATTLDDLEERAGAMAAQYDPDECHLVRPTGGQEELVRSMLPGTSPAPVCRDYTQFLLPGDLAGAAPFCGPQIGDPQGGLLGETLDTGTPAPVLFDAGYGSSVNKSPSLAAVGRLGSGKSYMLKTAAWDTLARGGQLVTLDRTEVGEYVAFARVAPGASQVVRLTEDSVACIDPLAIFDGDQRATVTLGFLSLLAGCAAKSEEGSALGEAVESVVGRADGRLADVVTALDDMAAAGDVPARAVARRLRPHTRRGVGRLAFAPGRPVSLRADLIVFHAPGLRLPDRDKLARGTQADDVLPEEMAGQALLYLVAAAARRVVFADPARFGAVLLDEAYALLASPHGRKLVVEGVRDGRKHQAAMWLASQLGKDFDHEELLELLGPRFVFDQGPGGVPSALRLLGLAGSTDALHELAGGLESGECLYRDVRGRVGLIGIRTAVDAEIAAAFNTKPGGTPDAGAEQVAVEHLPAPEETSAPERPAVADRPDPVPVDLRVARRSGLPGSPAAAAADARNRARRRRRSPLAQALAERT